MVCFYIDLVLDYLMAQISHEDSLLPILRIRENGDGKGVGGNREDLSLADFVHNVRTVIGRQQ
jgi:hypothetical protein